MHQSIKNASLLFNMLGVFSGACVALLILLFVGSKITDEIQGIGILSLLLSLIIPVLNFAIGWGFAKQKYWAWFLGCSELFIIALYGLYQLVISDLGGIAVLMFAGPGLLWLIDIRRVFICGNA